MDIKISCSLVFIYQKEDPGGSVQKKQVAADEKPEILPETLEAGQASAVRNESQMEGEGSHVEYTELALDCLDLKAQEELLSPPLSGDHSISPTDLAS